MTAAVVQAVGLYRLCGSAAVKKELRDWFESNSLAVCLGEDLYPDINVITGDARVRFSHILNSSRKRHLKKKIKTEKKKAH